MLETLGPLQPGVAGRKWAIDAAEAAQALHAVAVRTLLVALFACSAPNSGWEGTETVVDGVAVVSNPDRPLVSGAEASLVLTWSTTGGGPDGESWAEPRHLAVLRGTAFVLDGQASRLHLIDTASGRPVAVRGGPGEGPGELAGPVGITSTETRVAVLDAGKQTIESWDEDGEHVGSTRLGAIGLAVVGIGGEETLVVRAGEPELVVLDAAGESRPIRLDSLATPEGIECRGFASIGDAIARFGCLRPHFEVFDRSGRKLREVVVERPPVERSPEMLEAYLDAIARRLAPTSLPVEQRRAMIERQRAQERYRRSFRALRFDETNGRIAVLDQEADDFEPDGARLHVFTRAGRYLAVIELDRLWWDFRFHEGDVLALTREPASDVVALTRYRLELP